LENRNNSELKVLQKSHKLDQAVVLYMNAKTLGSRVGAHCGDCWKFVAGEVESGECIEVEGDINGPHGVCGLYVNGRVFENGRKPDFSVVKVSKIVAGYVEQGPTHCENCDEFVSRDNCKKVENYPQTIEEGGCCNRWEPEGEE
jgi:hypothetical protein